MSERDEHRSSSASTMTILWIADRRKVDRFQAEAEILLCTSDQTGSWSTHFRIEKQSELLPVGVKQLGHKAGHCLPFGEKTKLLFLHTSTYYYVSVIHNKAIKCRRVDISKRSLINLNH